MLPVILLFRRLFAATVSALLALGLPAASSLAQGGYVFTKIIDNETVRPDGLGNFYTGFPLATPTLDGDTLIFQDLASNDNSLWSASASGVGAPVKLIDFRTPVPGGVGNFSRLNDQTARTKDGLVFFEGLDSVPADPGHHLHGGIYTVPTGGGAVSKVVDYHTIAPEASGGPFVAANGNNMLTAGFNDGDFDYEAGIIAFHGTTDAAGDGIYSVHLNGTNLVRLADRNTEGTPRPFPVGQYYTAALHNHLALFHGGTVFGPYGLFTSPEAGGLSAPALLASPSTPLPGGQSPETTANYYTGFSQFDHQTGRYVFAGYDGSGTEGIYALQPAGFDGTSVTKIVDTQTNLAGSTRATTFHNSVFSADGGQVAFVTSTNASAGQFGALYVAKADGSITRVVGVNDFLDGIKIAGITLGAHALSNGRIAFGAGSIFQGHDGLPRYGAVFVATPAEQADNLGVTLAGSTTQSFLNQLVLYTASVKNNGPAAGAGVALKVTLPAGLTFVSATGGASAVDGVVTLYVGALPDGGTAAFDVVARVNTTGSLVTTATATGSVVDANVVDNTAQATLDASELPSVTLAATVPTVTAGTGAQGVFTLTLPAPLDHDVIVNFTIKGTAANGTDYVQLKTTKKIKAGKTGKPIKVTPLGVGAGTGVKRTVVLTLQPGDGYLVGTPGKVKVKIVGQ